MHNHFDQFLNLKGLILERKPKVIVECGAGNGELTEKLASLLDVYFFELHVISDHRLHGLDSRIQWHEGLSYEELAHFPEGSLDLCIIDTDHNYWTLMKELAAAFDKMTEGGLVAMHDVSTFYHDTGMAKSYWDGKPYPEADIMACAPYGGLGDALIDFLHTHKTQFRMLAWNPCSHGAAVIEKKHQPIFVIKTPGPEAVFTKKEIHNAPVLQAR